MYHFNFLVDASSSMLNKKIDLQNNKNVNEDVDKELSFIKKIKDDDQNDINNLDVVIYCILKIIKNGVNNFEKIQISLIFYSESAESLKLTVKEKRREYFSVSKVNFNIIKKMIVIETNEKVKEMMSAHTNFNAGFKETTRLMNSIQKKVRTADYHPYIFFFTDGERTKGNTLIRVVKEYFVEKDAPIYTFGLGDLYYQPELEKAAEITNGNFKDISSIEDLGNLNRIIK